MQGGQIQFMAPGSMVKKLIIVNVAIWLVFQVILENLVLSGPFVTETFGLIPAAFFENFYVWQVVTYMFLHSLSPMHIVFNMISLWFFGSELEMRWGAKLFLGFYFFTGIGAGLIYLMGMAIAILIKGYPPAAFMQPVIGASGAVFGVLLAYGILFGDRMIYFFGVFPMQARFFVALMGAFEVLSLLTSGLSGGVANLAHLGGLLSGLIFLVGWTKLQQFRWRKTSTARRNLKLVVNKKDDADEGPKYWN